MKISIRKDGLEKKALPHTSWYGNTMAVDPDQEINRVDIDTSKGPIEVYVDGELVKPKRYVLPMPGTEYHNLAMKGTARYYAVKGTENWRPDAIALGTDDAVEHGYTVTQADIGAAPDWVKAIKPVEVTDDEQ